jgi:hypothetical protein
MPKIMENGIRTIQLTANILMGKVLLRMATLRLSSKAD